MKVVWKLGTSDILWLCLISPFEIIRPKREPILTSGYSILLVTIMMLAWMPKSLFELGILSLGDSVADPGNTLNAKAWRNLEERILHDKSIGFMM